MLRIEANDSLHLIYCFLDCRKGELEPLPVCFTFPSLIEAYILEKDKT